MRRAGEQKSRRAGEQEQEPKEDGQERGLGVGAARAEEH